MRRFTLIRPEGSQAVHVRILHGRALCGLVFDPGKAEKVKPVDVAVKEICPSCLCGHFRRASDGKK